MLQWHPRYYVPVTCVSVFGKKRFSRPHHWNGRHRFQKSSLWRAFLKKPPFLSFSIFKNAIKVCVIKQKRISTDGASSVSPLMALKTPSWFSIKCVDNSKLGFVVPRFSFYFCAPISPIQPISLQKLKNIDFSFHFLFQYEPIEWRLDEQASEHALRVEALEQATLTHVLRELWLCLQCFAE